MSQDKFHTIKFWNESSSRVTTKEYVLIETIKDFIDQQVDDAKELSSAVLLVKLEQLVTHKAI